MAAAHTTAPRSSPAGYSNGSMPAGGRSIAGSAQAAQPMQRVSTEKTTAR